MSEDNEAELAQAREQLAAVDFVVADLLARGDPAAEHAAFALALNEGNLARALVGLARAKLDLERSSSAGFRRAR